MRFYRFSDKAIRENDLDIEERLLLFVRVKGQDGMSFICDPYRKCLYGQLMKEVSDFSRASLENLRYKCGLDGDFKKDSYYTELPEEEVFSGRYFEWLRSFVPLEEYRKWALNTVFPDMMVTRLNGNGDLWVTNEAGEEVRRFRIKNTFINRYWPSANWEFKLDYQDGMYWVGLVPSDDLDTIQNAGDDAFVYIQACSLSYIQVRQGPLAWLSICMTMLPVLGPDWKDPQTGNGQEDPEADMRMKLKEHQEKRAGVLALHCSIQEERN